MEYSHWTEGSLCYQDVINIASSFNFRTSKIKLFASVQGTCFETWECLLFLFFIMEVTCVSKSLENSELNEVSHGIFSFTKTSANLFVVLLVFSVLMYFFFPLHFCNHVLYIIWIWCISLHVTSYAFFSPIFTIFMSVVISV